MILIAITYLAGVLTILSPCILPVLPFVFSKSQGSFLKNAVPLLLGMVVTFSFFSAIALIGGEFLSKLSEYGRLLAMVFLTLFGLSLIFQHQFEKLMEPITRLGSKIGSQKKGAGGSFLVGVSTGLLWAPCAGPILGLVLTGAASQKNTSYSIALLVAYSLGAATSLAVALLAGNKLLGKLKGFLGVDQYIKKAIGVAVLVGVVIIAFHLDRTLLTQLSKLETISVENKLLGLVKDQNAEKSSDSESTTMPELTGAISWLNSQPLTSVELKGKVVLVDFWTYSCINCLRSLPYVKAWAEKYKGDGLIVIGIHTPEFAFEKNADNVQKAITDLGITYPVAIDSNYEIWNRFGNQYWPAHYFFDRKGIARHHHFGEGEYDESEEIIQKLLTENGGTLSDKKLADVKAEGVQLNSENSEMTSPETYVGYSRAKDFASTPAPRPDVAADYKQRQNLKLNQWGLAGNWLVGDEKAVSQRAKAKIYYKFFGRDLHLVLGGVNIHFKVSIDGAAPQQSHGLDIDEAGRGVINGQRLYQLIRQPEKNIQPHLFEIEFEEPRAEAYAFTFG